MCPKGAEHEIRGVLLVDREVICDHAARFGAIVGSGQANLLYDVVLGKIVPTTLNAYTVRIATCRTIGMVEIIVLKRHVRRINTIDEPSDYVGNPYATHPSLVGVVEHDPDWIRAGQAINR